MWQKVNFPTTYVCFEGAEGWLFGIHLAGMTLTPTVPRCTRVCVRVCTCIHLHTGQVAASPSSESSSIRRFQQGWGRSSQGLLHVQETRQAVLSLFLQTPNRLIFLYLYMVILIKTNSKKNRSEEVNITAHSLPPGS